MFVPALRDLQWRRRRFTIAIAGTALTFGITLVLTGLTHGFDVEAQRTVRVLRVDEWIVQNGANGPFLGNVPFPASDLARVANLPGVRRAAPIAWTRKDVGRPGQIQEANIFGALPGGPGMPKATTGRSPRQRGEIAVSTKLRRAPIGKAIEVAGQRFTVVGKVAKSTAFAGVPNLYLTLPDAQTITYHGDPAISAIAVKGRVGGPLPPGLKAISNRTARADMARALTQAKKAVALCAVISWIVATTIVGSVVYLSALERQRDFAVFKATGISTRSILAGLATQSVLVAVTAAVLGIAIASLLAPHFPLPVSITSKWQVLLPGIGVAAGLVASLAGIRRVVTVDPALAFAGP